MYTTVYAKIRINMDKHGKAMSNIGLEQGCPLSPPLFGLYIDEIVKDSLCLFNAVVAILLYVDDVVMLYEKYDHACKDF